MVIGPHNSDVHEAQREGDVAWPLSEQQVLETGRRIRIAWTRDPDAQREQGGCECEHAVAERLYARDTAIMADRCRIA